MTTKIICGDCRLEIPKLAPQSVDLVLTDPPYEETNLEWDRWPPGWLDGLQRAMKPHASLWLFGSLKMFMRHGPEIEAAGFTLVQDLVWEKPNGSNALNDRFRRVHEAVAHFRPTHQPWAETYKAPVFTDDATARVIRRKRKPAHWNRIESSHYVSHDGGPRLMRSVLPCPSEHGKASHPTQKPVALMLPIIKYSCPPGGLVLDPFGGSGSTAIAVKIADRDCILIEANPGYVKIARQRLEGDVPLLAGAA